jgi:hypothetical protein
MAQLTPERLEALILEYGWTFSRLGPCEWESGFRGEQSFYPLLITLSSTCVYFEVCPLIDIDFDLRSRAHLACNLLELNASLQLVKLGVTDDGEIALSCQVLSTACDADVLAKVLGILAYYAESVIHEIKSRFAHEMMGGRPQLLS